MEVIDTRICQDEQIIACAVRVLQQGGLVAMPTDTVYGLAANAFDDQAVQRIFAAKDRPPHNPLPVLIASPTQLTIIAWQIPPTAWQLAEQFWPGPLTIVLPKSPLISNLVTAGRPSVAVRVPDYPLTQAILEDCPFPVAVTSANLSGQPSVVAADQVAEILADWLDLLIKAPPCPGSQPSTVVDLTTSPPTLLRPGPVSIAELQDIVGIVQSDS